MISAAHKEYDYYKHNGHCFDLGSLAYDYLVSKGKIEVPAKDKEKGLKYAKDLIIEEWKVDLEFASDKMKKHWQDKINNIDSIVEKALGKNGSVIIREKVYTYFKRYKVNEYFSGV